MRLNIAFDKRRILFFSPYHIHWACIMPHKEQKEFLSYRSLFLIDTHALTDVGIYLTLMAACLTGQRNQDTIVLTPVAKESENEDLHK